MRCITTDNWPLKFIVFLRKRWSKKCFLKNKTISLHNCMHVVSPSVSILSPLSKCVFHRQRKSSMFSLSRFWLLLPLLPFLTSQESLLSSLLLSFVVFPQLIDLLSHGVHYQAAYLWGYLCFSVSIAFRHSLEEDLLICGIQF